MNIVPSWLYESGFQLTLDNKNDKPPCLQQPGALAILKICTVTLLSDARFIQTPDQTKVRCEVGEGHRMSSRNLLHILSQTFTSFFVWSVLQQQVTAAHPHLLKATQRLDIRGDLTSCFYSWLSVFSVDQCKACNQTLE